MTNWAALQDQNPENRVAGNADDLVKHATYLSLLSYLLGHEPWRRGLRARECHAGRGIYAVPPDSPRRRGIEGIADVPLALAQRTCLAAQGADAQCFYAGSALLNSHLLDRHAGTHSYEAYEWDPQTRRILRDVVGAERVLGDEGDGRFDGETHIADQLPTWCERDVVFMDPFGIWNRDKHAPRRARFRRIFDGLARHPACPVWLLYLTTRRGHGSEPMAGLIEQPLVEVVWHFSVPCRLWIAPPREHLEALGSVVAADLTVLEHHLARSGVLPDAARQDDARIAVHVR